MQQQQLSDREFEQFRSFIYEIAGIAMTSAKKQLVAGRLGKRLRHYELERFSDYFELIMKDRQECQTAVDLLTTNETYFFREPKHFEFLRDRLHEQFARGSTPFRIWSAACSTGEEPYTLALLLADHLLHRPWEILASDLSQRVLQTARAGIYPLDSRGIDPQMLRRHCLKGTGEHEGSFMIQPALGRHVNFRQINLNQTLPDVGHFEVIFLRNVMIYFDLETKRQVVRRLCDRLRPGGFMFVSHSESLNGVTSDLTLVRPSIYRKDHG